MRAAFTCFLAAMLLVSCGEPTTKTVQKVSIKPDSVKPVTTKAKNVIDTIAIPDDTIPKVTIPEGAIQVPEDKIDTIYKIKVLYNNVTYEQGDISPADTKLNWIGIFNNKDDYYIKPTKIKLIKAHSELDEDGKNTGFNIKLDVKDTCFRLIGGADNLQTGPVKRAFKEFDLVHAGQKLVFNYYGVNYTLYTTGYKKDGKTYNFKLFLMANVKGHVFNQLLHSLAPNVALRDGIDNVDTIFLDFAGDIDGDKIPDFIISDAGFAFGSTSLYLSKPAGDKAIVKLVCYSESRD